MKKIRRKGTGKDCPKCLVVMERREHVGKVTSPTYFFTEWDYCKPCKYVQHYEEFKKRVDEANNI